MSERRGMDGEGARTMQDAPRGHADDGGPFSDVQHVQRRLFLEAFCELGTKTAAAEAVGISPWTPYSPAWKRDDAFQDGLRVAEEVAADKAEHEAWRRGVEGLKRFKHSSKTDQPLLHPEECECGAPRNRHVGSKDGRRPCPETGCEDFAGRPYFEVEHSDGTLVRLLQAYRPQKFGEKLQVSQLVANVNLTLLPDQALARIADGEDMQAVLASVIAEGGEDAAKVRAALPPGSKAGRRPGELVQEDDGRGDM